MTFYVINENVTDAELSAIASAGGQRINVWPNAASDLPSDISVGVLIIREESSALEEERVIQIISIGLRIVCVFMEELPKISDLAHKYCSAKVALNAGALGEALMGSDAVQQDDHGAPAPRNRQKPHNC